MASRLLPRYILGSMLLGLGCLQKWCSRLSAVHISAYQQKELAFVQVQIFVFPCKKLGFGSMPSGLFFMYILGSVLLGLGCLQKSCSRLSAVHISASQQKELVFFMPEHIICIGSSHLSVAFRFSAEVSVSSWSSQYVVLQVPCWFCSGTGVRYVGGRVSGRISARSATAGFPRVSQCGLMSVCGVARPVCRRLKAGH